MYEIATLLHCGWTAWHQVVCGDMVAGGSVQIPPAWSKAIRLVDRPGCHPAPTGVAPE